MNKLLKGIGLRYGLLFTLFGGFIIIVLLRTEDFSLFWNLIITFVMLALLPVCFYFLWKNKIKNKRKK